MMKAKLILLILALISSCTLSGQEIYVKKIAVLQTVAQPEDFGRGEMLMIGNRLAAVLKRFAGYRVYERVDISAIIDEQKFQRSGLVSDTQIKKIGELAGVDLVLYSEISRLSNGGIYIYGKVMDVETSEWEMFGDATAENIGSIEGALRTMCDRMLGADSNNGGSLSEYKSNISSTIEYVVFPDPIFRAYVLANFDTNGDGKISREEAGRVTKIDVNKTNSTIDNEKISSLVGIQYFTDLKELRCDYNKLTTLDLSKNTALKTLCCDSNRLTALDVSNNTALTELSCDSNQLTTLDVSKNTALTELSCNSNRLTTLDVSKNTALAELSCNSNQLTTLDVSNNKALKTLSCNSNQLTTLDVSDLNITYLDCAPMETLGNLILRSGQEITDICSSHKVSRIQKDTRIICELAEETIPEDDQPFFKVEQMPSFQGGDLYNFREWVFRNVKFPQIAQEHNISGRVLVLFVIERDGSLSNIQVLQSPHPSLSAAAIEVLEKSPKWIPGMQRNQTVRVKYTLPIDFHIQN